MDLSVIKAAISTTNVMDPFWMINNCFHLQGQSILLFSINFFGITQQKKLAPFARALKQKMIDSLLRSSHP